MACCKYILTNTGNTIVTFNYQRCDDSLQVYQMELLPNETKNIWLIDETYNAAPLFGQLIVIQKECPFPPTGPSPTPSVTPTITPTTSVTPTITPTQTPTTSVTPTITPTQTVTPTNSRVQFITSFGNTSNDACYGTNLVTIWAEDPQFDENIQFYDSPFGPVTTDMTGFYSYNSVVTEIDSVGAQVGVYFLCPTSTPTPTQTPTTSVTPTITPTTSVTPTITPTTSVTPTVTPTITQTQTVTPTASVTPTVTPTITQTQTPTITQTPTTTSTPTPSIGFYTYSLGYDVSVSSTACSNYGTSPTNYYAPLVGGPGPNVGETLYSDSGLTIPASNGYYSNGTAWYLVTGGAGLVTSVDPNGC